MANANYSHTERCALIVREDNVKHLAKSLADYTGGAASVSFHFTDGFSYSSEDVEEVLAASRLRSTLVERVTISSRSPTKAESWRIADVSMRESVGSGAIAVDIRSNADDMSHLVGEVERETKVMTPSYHLLHKGSPPLIYYAGMILAPAYGVWAIRNQIIILDSTKADVGAFVNFTAYVVLYGIAGLGLAHGIRTIAKRWMPAFMVAIGKGAAIADGNADGRKWAFRLVSGAILLAVGGAVLRSLWAIGP